MIREATPLDLDDLVDFCMECNAAMPWQDYGLGVDVADIRTGLVDFLYSDVCDLSVVELDGEIAGACAVSIQPYFLNRSTLVSSEWIWHMKPSFPDGILKRKWVIRMLDHMLVWSREKGARVFKAAALTTDKALMELLTRRGIMPLETACVGRL